MDILIEALSEVGGQGGIQVVVLGTGKKVLEEAVLKLDQQFPETVKGVVKFDVPLAHLMTAGNTPGLIYWMPQQNVMGLQRA